MPKRAGIDIMANSNQDVARPGDFHSVSQSVLRSEQGKRWMKQYRTELAASSASLLASLVTYPADSLKTRLQAYKFRSMVDCVHQTYKSEGFHGFWRGVLSPLASITLVRTVSFSIYQKSKYTLDEWIYNTTGSSPLQRANTKGANPNWATMLCFGISGAVAGGAITAIACPFELTKVSAQISTLMTDRKDGGGTNDAVRKRYQNLGTWKTAQTIIRYQGWTGLYSGYRLHLMRDTLGTGLYFLTYESTKQLLANARGNSPATPLAVVTAGGMCGIVSWACIFPIDTVKSIYQRNCLVSDGKTKPTRPKIDFLNPRMYRGLTVSMTRSCIVNAIFFTVFEFSKKSINHLDVDEDLLREHGL